MRSTDGNYWPSRNKWYVGHELDWQPFDSGEDDAPGFTTDSEYPFIVSPPRSLAQKVEVQSFKTYAEALAWRP